jgi:hypothetical protein
MMSGNPYFPRLFGTLKVGGRTLRNRIALTATLTNYATAHRITERWIDFLAERAKGGCGMVISEVIAVDPVALAHGAIVTGYQAENEEGFRRACRCGGGGRGVFDRAAVAPRAAAAVEPGAIAEGDLGPARCLQLDCAPCDDHR